MNYFVISIGITMDGKIVSNKNLAPTNHHEARHSAGLNHPWVLSDIEKEILPQLDQLGSKPNKKLIWKNFMNSYDNIDDEYRNSKGTELLPRQLLSMFKNIF